MYLQILTEQRDHGVANISSEGLAELAGVNAANAALYEALVSSGFVIDLTGIAMQRPNRPGLCAPEHWVVGDWR